MNIIPDDYQVKLNLRETESAIKKVKDFFQITLSSKLNLQRVSAPMFVKLNTGLNDNLSGREKAVDFTITALNDVKCEIVHSLAKWKRMALKKYNFAPGEGLYTDMNAIRRQEDVLDNLHSVYVDQWDWEKIIEKEQRTREFLHKIVRDIYSAIYETADAVEKKYPQLKNFFAKEITFIKSQELEDEYPSLTPSQREYKAAKKYGAIFVENIGCKLNSGEKHDMRSPDYDDWSLNGDIIIWYPILQRQVELSSMGIRVDKQSLERQLKIANVKKYTEYHKNILNENFPLTIGGGIGQSRLCLVMLQKAHIGEVQSSLWPEETINECESKNIILL